MRKLRTPLLLAGGALLAAGAAVAAESRTHVMNIALPDGAVAQIRYEGDRASHMVVSRTVATPIVIFDRARMPALSLASMAIPMANLDMRPVLADFARFSAMMEMQSRAMMQRMAQMERQLAQNSGLLPPDALRMVSAGQAPAGVVQYRYVSTTSRDGCTTSVQWSSDGSGAQPKVVKASSGACGAQAHKPQPVKAPAEAGRADREPVRAAVPGTRRT